MTINFRAIVLAAAALALTLSTGSSFAQTQVKVNVPFAFQNGSQRMPAGVYTFSQLEHSVITIQGQDQSGKIMTRVETDRAPERGKAVFERVGNQYFLHEVWQAGNRTHLVCAQTSQEKAAKKILQSYMTVAEATPVGPIEVAAVEAAQ